MDRPQIPSITARDGLKALVLLTIPAILAVIYYRTTLSFQQSLALDHTQPRIHNFWTNALVHDHQPGDRHLINNICGYLLLVFPCWILYIYREHEHQFWTGLVIILTLGPFIISVSSYIAFNELLGVTIENDRGFSGVVGAIAGFLFVSLLHTFAQTQDDSVAMLSIGLYFGYLMLGLGILTGRIIAIGVGALVLVGMGVGMQTSYLPPGTALFDWGAEHRRLSVVLGVAILVSVLGFAAALPAEITSGDGVTNIIAHGSGLLLGMAVGVGLRYRAQQFSAGEPIPRSK